MADIQKTIRLVAVTAGAGAIFAMGSATGTAVVVSPTASPASGSQMNLAPNVKYNMNVGRLDYRAKRVPQVGVEIDFFGNVTYNPDAGSL